MGDTVYHAAKEEGRQEGRKIRLQEELEGLPGQIQGWCLRQEEEMVKGQGSCKLNNAVCFDQATYDKMMKEAASWKLVTPSVLSERLKINGSLARRAIKELLNAGSLRLVDKHSSQQIYTRNTGDDASVSYASA